MTIVILGRQPKLGLAELESLFGAEHVTPLGEAALVDLPIETVNAAEIGSAMKVATVLTELPTTDWSRLVSYCHDELPSLLSNLPFDGKLKFGLSVYDLKVSLISLQKSGLSLKKAIKQSGRSVRLVPNTELELNSAQVLHNKLTAELGWELLFVRNGTNTFIAKTVRVQNIEAYTYRDRHRPRRDAFVGMLPPKLAQTMINLAAPAPGSRILDPFCGTGVVLQEAALYGHPVYGTDKSDKMVRYSHDNLVWLKDTHRVQFDMRLEEADAQTYTWHKPIDTIVCEGYLGQPMSVLPPKEKFEEIVHGCNSIARSFLKTLAPQIKPGSRHTIALPAWKTSTGFRHLSVIDDLSDLGYNRIDFKHANREDLLYHRPDQIVARELLVLTRK